MQYDNNSTIKSIEDVKTFFNFLVNDLNVNFHADTPFCEYINSETNKPTFTEDECKLYDRLMQEAFEVCEKSGGESLVYDIGTEILKENLYKKIA